MYRRELLVATDRTTVLGKQIQQTQKTSYLTCAISHSTRQGGNQLATPVTKCSFVQVIIN